MILRALLALSMLVHAGSDAAEAERLGPGEGYVVGAFTWSLADMQSWDRVGFWCVKPEATIFAGCTGFIDGIPLRRGSQVFVGRLPVGRYRIDALYDSRVNEQSGSFAMLSTSSLSARDGMFTISAGQVTDLGVLAFPPKPKFQRPWPATFVLAGHTAASLRFAAITEPGIRGLPVDRQWAPDGDDDRIVTQLRVTASLRGALLDLGARGLIGRGGHGGVHRLGPGANWTVEHLGVPFAVEALGAAADGTLVAASEFGDLHLSREPGRWTAMPAPEGVWRVAAIWFAPDGRLHIVGGRGLVLATGLARFMAAGREQPNGRPETLAVYSCRGTLPDCTWTELHARPWDNREIDIVTTPNSLIVFDEKAELWATDGSAQPPKLKVDADHVGVAGPDALTAWDQSGSKHTELRISSDQGATWRALGDGSKKDAPMAKVSAPFVLAAGDALFGKVRRKAGSQHYDFKLFMSHDSGARWLPVAEHDPTCALDEWVGVVRGALMVNCGDGRVLRYDGVAATPERLR